MFGPPKGPRMGHFQRRIREYTTRVVGLGVDIFSNVCNSHSVYMAGVYEMNPIEALDEAIKSLTLIKERLETMSVPTPVMLGYCRHARYTVQCVDCQAREEI